MEIKQRIRTIQRSQSEPYPHPGTLWLVKCEDGHFELRLCENGEWRPIGCACNSCKEPSVEVMPNIVFIENAMNSNVEVTLISQLSWTTQINND